MTPEKAAEIILDTVALDKEQYRLGKTKVLIPDSTKRIARFFREDLILTYFHLKILNFRLVAAVCYF